jgi:molecular chaperone HtpG
MTEQTAPDIQPGVQPDVHEYRTEVKQLLDILAHSLYTDRELFLRELISNASDALNRIQFEMLTNHEVVDPDAELAIHLQPDREAKTITLSDSGIGMNRDELMENLGAIAHSGARTFLQSAGQGQATLEEIIGQFGVGFYSVFMVADEVQVTSRSFRPDDQAWTWRSTGDSTYTLEPADQTGRGTTIVIKLKEDATEFANGWRLEQIVKKHSDYVSFPIYLSEPKAGEETAPEPRMINRRTALWRQTPSKVEAAEYNDFYKQLTYDTTDPLLHVHLVADAPVNLRAVLFIPAQRERGRLHIRPDLGVRLYSRKILIQEHNNELLPDFYQFVEGVVDSDDLPLNVSREMVQSNPVLRQIRRALTNRLNKDLRTLADDEPEKYAAFWSEFGVFLKSGVASDPSNQEALLDLLRFHTSKGGANLVSLKQIVARMQPGQDAIYYVLGEDLKSVARSPHLDYFRAHELEVLYLVDPIDGFMTAMLREVEGKRLQNVDDAGLSLPTDAQAGEQQAGSPVPQAQFDPLVARVKQVLGERVVDVQASKQLVNSPCRLVSPADNYDRDLQRLRRLTEEDYETPKKILELNRGHPLVSNLARLVEATPDDPLLDASIEQLYDNALLLEGLHANPAEMVERIQLLMEQAVAAKAAGEHPI